MGAPDPTAGMSGVATPAQQLSQPRTSGRKRKPVSYAEDQPNAVLEAPPQKRRSKAVARAASALEDGTDGSALSRPAKQAGKAKGKAPATTIEKRLKRQDLNAKLYQ
ncbi:Ring finger domain protein [Neofusicoccum parvum]|uniref:Ring finger domain protein n=1 Tax=Neofusicoccum parvum TaxID=310453 RepID=A0ACB5S1W6_9PEZI|nr:Ring finger domain protein [Neofusicoccum parvum]GME63193.1 Ring finger domain protein [Neofusicoccum parvum]